VLLTLLPSLQLYRLCLRHCIEILRPARHRALPRIWPDDRVSSAALTFWMCFTLKYAVHYCCCVLNRAVSAGITRHLSSAPSPICKGWYEIMNARLLFNEHPFNFSLFLMFCLFYLSAQVLIFKPLTTFPPPPHLDLYHFDDAGVSHQRTHARSHSRSPYEWLLRTPVSCGWVFAIAALQC
jgi:hypothetical protein